MATTNYEIARERRKFYHRGMNQDTVSSESSGSTSNLESESKQHDDKQASLSCKRTRLTHKTDNTEDVRRVIVSESNDEDDDFNNEDADRSESERIMVPSGEYLIGAEIVTSCVLKSLYHDRTRDTSR